MRQTNIYIVDWPDQVWRVDGRLAQSSRHPGAFPSQGTGAHLALKVSRQQRIRLQGRRGPTSTNNRPKGSKVEGSDQPEDAQALPNDMFGSTEILPFNHSQNLRAEYTNVL